MRMWRLYFRRSRARRWIFSDFGDDGYRVARRLVPGVYWLGTPKFIDDVWKELAQ